MNYHLAILAKGWTELILEGKKTIESRFSKVRCAPFGKVHEGDIVYLKESCGPVKGMFTVAKVETFENLTDGQICDLFYSEYRKQIFNPSVSDLMGQPPEKWLAAKHATLIHISDVVRFDEPVLIDKRDSRAWVVLEHPLHKCGMCGDRYLLEVYEDPDGELIHGSQHFCPPCNARECVSHDEELAMAMEDFAGV